jgi:protein MpaA
VRRSLVVKPWHAASLCAAGAAIAGGAALASDPDGDGQPVGHAVRLHSSTHAAVRAAGIRRRIVLGRSVDGRAIYGYELAGAGARRTALVVGCIHGNEPAGTHVITRLARGPIVPGVDLWLIPSINPDGQAAGTRQNARGVDLNRNFPWRWRPLGPRGTQQYAGPHALSEPESRIAHSLIAHRHPAITIWFHQPLDVVDESGGSLALERRFARLAGLPLRRLPRYPGSAASWQNNRLRGTTAFVVELPPGAPSTAQARRWSAAVRESVAVGGS